MGNGITGKESDTPLYLNLRVFVFAAAAIKQRGSSFCIYGDWPLAVQSIAGALKVAKQHANMKDTQLLGLAIRV